MPPASIALASACGKTVTTTIPATTIPAGTTTVTVGTVTVPAGTTTVTATTTVPGPGTASDPSIVTFTVNKVSHTEKVKPWWPLSFVLRDKLGLYGTKVGCEAGQCASCTIIEGNDKAVLACLVLAIEADGKSYTTVEGLSDGVKLTPLQQKWFDDEAYQCGFCTPGFMMAAVALLAKTAKPNLAQVREAFSGHICTCTNLKPVVDSTVGGV